MGRHQLKVCYTAQPLLLLLCFLPMIIAQKRALFCQGPQVSGVFFPKKKFSLKLLHIVYINSPLRINCQSFYSMQHICALRKSFGAFYRILFITTVFGYIQNLLKVYLVELKSYLRKINYRQEDFDLRFSSKCYIFQCSQTRP